MRDVLLQRATPYCGAAPTPAAIVGRWNIDGVLIAVLVLWLAGFLWASWRDGGHPPVARWRVWCGVAGWLTALIVMVSPLCALSVALFSARVGEHMLLTTVSAPLVALGQPVARFRGLVGMAPRRWRPRPLAAAIGFAMALWFWHAPGPYDASFHSDAVFWAMQVTLYGTALWFWSALFDRAGDGFADAVLATFLTTGEMGLLGAVITFAGHPLYTQHLATTLAWGLTPLQDQQLGGVVMWIPAGAIFALALVGAFAALMRRDRLRATAA